MGTRTFAIIKPDAVKRGYTGKIYDRILQAGFNIISAKWRCFSTQSATWIFAAPPKAEIVLFILSFKWLRMASVISVFLPVKVSFIRFS